ncbi:hypothetical protein KIPB_000282 [Kipferlia bialata]|uniref:Uncharacterized protein n=1 Tax=Kipferlia bialata TaxID=797122 RepID=A0A9K3CNY1_9EUKA|nr:hypothetical protein KIPB_000282 [Kipferlia bialata]|eukprot:g282.t1
MKGWPGLKKFVRGESVALFDLEINYRTGNPFFLFTKDGELFGNKLRVSKTMSESDIIDALTDIGARLE